MKIRLATVAKMMMWVWVLLEMSNRAGFSLFMGRAPCVCDERTVYVVQATNPGEAKSRVARLRRALAIILPGLMLLILVEILLGAAAANTLMQCG